MADVILQFAIEFAAGCAFIAVILAVLIPVARRGGPAIAILYGIVGVLAVAAAATTLLALK